MRPNEITTLFRASLNPLHKKFAAQIYKEHLKPVTSVDKNFDVIYDNIKNDVMQRSSLVTEGELHAARNEQMQNTDWSSIINGTEAADPFLQPLNIEYDERVWNNASVAIITSIVLFEFFTRINK